MENIWKIVVFKKQAFSIFPTFSRIQKSYFFWARFGILRFGGFAHPGESQRKCFYQYADVAVFFCFVSELWPRGCFLSRLWNCCPPVFSRIWVPGRDLFKRCWQTRGRYFEDVGPPRAILNMHCYRTQVCEALFLGPRTFSKHIFLARARNQVGVFWGRPCAR